MDVKENAEVELPLIVVLAIGTNAPCIAAAEFEAYGCRAIMVLCLQ
jgi:hypothetical protein